MSQQAWPAVRVRRFYDRLGGWQDFQPYESPALDAVVRAGDFPRARSVFEFGCGTGRLARRLLSMHLSAVACYTAVDASATMAGIAARRLAPFGRRVQVLQVDGVPRIPQPDAAFDRFVCTYVLDLLSAMDQTALLGEAHRLLAPGGRLCLASLTPGVTRASRLVTALWRGAFAVSPTLVGGCRPTELRACVDTSHWAVRVREVVVRYGVASEVLIAEPRNPPAVSVSRL